MPELATNTDIDPRAAAGLLGKMREKENSSVEAPPEEAVSAPEAESVEETETAPVEEPTSGETEEHDPAPVTEPPIDAPRSWTNEDKAVFAGLPRETQQRLLELDRSRELEIRRGQNEAAEKTKALTAKEQAAEQARQQYEQALPNVLNLLNSQFINQFADIKTAEDVITLARNDPARYLEYDAMRKQGEMLQAEHFRAQQRQQQEAMERHQNFIQEQTKLFLEKAPEFADPAKASALQATVKQTFEDVGITEAEIGQIRRNGGQFSIDDHRVQLIVRKAMLYDQAQKALKAKTPAPVPPVQRPGTATSKNERVSAQVKDLKTKFEKSGSVKDAAALLRAQRTRAS